MKNYCVDFLASHSVRRILQNSDLSIPTLIIPWQRTFATHLRLAHFSENLFTNVTVICSNAEVREKEGFESGCDVLYGLDDHYEVEWVHGVEEGLALKDGFGGEEGLDSRSPGGTGKDREEGLAFKDGFWGKEGLDSRSPGGTGKDSAEVWFKKV